MKHRAVCTVSQISAADAGTPSAWQGCLGLSHSLGRFTRLIFLVSCRWIKHNSCICSGPWKSFHVQHPCLVLLFNIFSELN